MSLASKYEGIVVTSKQQYSCMQKVVCCKCFSCFQEEKIMTSDIRKETIQRMMQAYLVQSDDKILYDPVKLMILIYVCNDDNIPSKHIDKCKINPSTGVMNYRTDLEFYLPQMCNYIVFHRNLTQNYLKSALQKMCKLNYFFGHLYYFYMKSLQKNITKTQIQILKPVADYNSKLLQQLRDHYKSIKMTCLDLYTDAQPKRQDQEDLFVTQVIKDYQTTKMEYGRFTKVKPENISISTYYSIFEGEKGSSQSFESTINLYEDLFYMCNDLKNYENKKQKAIEYVKMINQNLPAAVYIPFSKNCYRLCNVLKIVTSQVKVFSTKQRAPVCLCLETYCPSEQLSQKDQAIFWTNVQTPFTLKMGNFANRGNYLARNFQQTAQFKLQRQSNNLKGTFQNIMEEERHLEQDRNNSIIRPSLLGPLAMEVEMDGQNIKKVQKERQESLGQQSIKNSESNESKSKTFREVKSYNIHTKKYYQKAFDKMFGQTLKQAKVRINKNSVFGKFKSWDILYIIVKTHDDLKQQQFAMQLIHQFDYIFKLQKLPLSLTTYQVLSLGPDKGIIEMVKDSVTFDSLKKTLKTEFPTQLTLKQFFEIYFEANLPQAKQNFLRSLAAYCLVMYVIQAKDRHNGNILLHRTGKMFHIDFGFFLSNMPGKGIQLEKDCPFKLLSQYVDVLDGYESSYFKKFRQYFFQGFKAIRKHQNKILMIVKMMYSANGMSMPCFSKGEATITAMEARINPNKTPNDLLLNEHCQQLINLSLDNWASKWYDRFQYWAQGIFY